MFSNTIVLLILYFLSDLSHGQRDKKFFRQDYTYIDAGEGFYRIHRNQRTWFDAKAECAGEGASLFFPENDAEAEAVVEFWDRFADSIDRLLLGMSELMVEGEFRTLDGKPINKVYNKWKPGEPSHSGDNEHCVNWHKGGLLNDCPCDYRDNFICKKSLKTLEWNYPCNMSNMDYTYNKDMGKCYKVHTTPLNWIQARARCEMEIAQLAIVTHPEEAEYLATLIESTPAPRTSDNYLRGLYHVGFHNIFNEGWKTVEIHYTETPLPKLDPAMWWGNYQPEGNGQCGSMFFNGLLNCGDCDTKSFFICEKVLESSNSLD